MSPVLEKIDGLTITISKFDVRKFYETQLEQARVSGHDFFKTVLPHFVEELDTDDVAVSVYDLRKEADTDAVISELGENSEIPFSCVLPLIKIHEEANSEKKFLLGYTVRHKGTNVVLTRNFQGETFAISIYKPYEEPSRYWNISSQPLKNYASWPKGIWPPGYRFFRLAK